MYSKYTLDSSSRRKFKRSLTMASIPASLLLDGREKEALDAAANNPCLSPRILGTGWAGSFTLPP